MKTLHKFILAALVAIFSFGYASADFRFGIKAGLNFNSVDFKNLKQSVVDEGNRTGWMAGVMAEFTVPIINIGMDASVLYARQNVNNNPYYENKDFLDIPVNLKWKINVPVVGSIIKPMIYTGPDFMFALNKHTFDNIKSRTCEIGWNLGIGVELLRHLQVQAGYCFGMNNVAKAADAVGVGFESADLKVKKNYWSLTAAYLF